MKVVDTYVIKDAGHLVAIDSLPYELHLKSVVVSKTSGLRWIVSWIDRHRRSPGEAGLLLRGQTTLPPVGTELEIE